MALIFNTLLEQVASAPPPVTPTHFSLTAVIWTAAITFVFSGLFGAMFKEWLDRPKPEIVISSIGLDGEDAQVEVPVELISLSKNSGWITNLHRYESFDVLKAQAERLLRTQARLTLAIPNAEAWLKDHAIWHDQSNQVASNEFVECPYFADETVPTLLIGAARRGELRKTPIDRAHLDTLNSVTDYHQHDHDWFLYMGKITVRFPIAKALTAYEKNEIEFIGYAFSKGSAPCIYHFIQEFRRIALEDLQVINQLIDHLRRLLIPASHIIVNTVLTNTGAKSITIRPFARLSILHDELSEFKPIMAFASPTKEPKEQLSSNSNETKRSSKSDEVKVEFFLPSTGDANYICIPPRSSVTATLKSKEALGELHGKKIHSLYSSSILKCSLRLLTLNDKKVTSSAAIFGADATQHDVKKLRS